VSVSDTDCAAAWIPKYPVATITAATPAATAAIRAEAFMPKSYHAFYVRQRTYPNRAQWLKQIIDTIRFP
jgi:hypothetical protein